ncbi:MAG: hypothetical protein ACRCW3_00260 [Metamycoplasmataceae bacterium]
MKPVRVYFNNKPWLTKELNEEKVCIQGDIVRVKDNEKEFRTKVRIAKINFKNSVEHKFCVGNVKRAWEELLVQMWRGKGTARSANWRLNAIIFMVEAKMKLSLKVP